MTPHQKQLVQTTFAKVAPIADEAAALFYGRLFELDPSLRPLFKTDLKEQGRKLMRMIGMAVNGLDRLDELVPAVRQLGMRHSPSLEFIHDALPETARHLDDVLARAREIDEQVAAVAAGAAYAGGEDPYKKPHVDDELDEDDELADADEDE